MQQYKYTAINLQKEEYKGIFIAEDEADLAVQLSKQGLYLVSATPYSGKSPSAFFTMGTGKVKLAELTAFCRQYSIMINSGISLLGAIEILKEQKFSNYFKALLQVVYEDVKGGMMLSEALRKHKGVFPDFFCAMIKVGETSGKLDIVMNSLADYYEKDNAIKRKVKSAFAYPIMLMCMTVGIIVLMLAFVVPTFRESLSSLDIEPEGLTKAVYDISDFILGYGLYLLAAVLLIGIAIFAFSRTEKGRYVFDWLKVNVPVIRRVNIDLITARFARGFGLLLSSGMDMTEAMDAVKIVFGNRDVKARFDKAAEDVKHGMTLAVAFNQYKLFPDMLTQMVSVGEKTASLDDVLTRSCAYFDDAVERSLNSVTSKIQPIMLIILGGIVGLLFIAVYSPMLSIMTGLGA